MFKKRLFAYITDILLLSMILSIVCLFITTSDNITNLNNQLIEINNNFINSDINIKTYMNRYFNIIYNMDKELFITNLINVVGMILYFIVYPLYNNGQSIGKKLNKIKIVSKTDEEVSANGLIFRYLFIDGLGSTLLSMCLLFVLKDIYYVPLVIILGFLQFLVVIISIFMILYRRDKRSLPDLIAGTKVIEVEK